MGSSKALLQAFDNLITDPDIVALATWAAANLSVGTAVVDSYAKNITEYKT